MSLIGALNTATSSLAVQQAAIQTTGNNIANAGDANYTRQVANISPSADQQLTPGIFLGTGVDLTAVQRQVDDALNTRLNAAISDNKAASTSSDWLSRIETTFNELGSADLSTSLSTFFGSWSNLANNPQDAGLRQVVVQNGQTLANDFQSLRSQLSGLQADVDAALKTQTAQADSLASQIADLNGEITIAEGGSGGQANALRDQRDALIKQLSELVHLQTVPQANGVVDVYVGSDPLVAGTQSRGVALRQKEVDGQLQSTVVFKASNGTIQLSSGSLKGLADARAQVSNAVEHVDLLAKNLVFELNKLHSSGQGLEGFSTVTATNAVNDSNAALNSGKTGLNFTPNNGSFVVHVTDKATGQVTSTLVPVPLTGGPGDASLNSLTASLGTISGVSASTNGGKLTVAAANSGVTVSFSQDSSGVLAALGINSFFSGSDASDIAVNAQIAADPTLVAAGKNGDAGDNQTATAIANLESNPVKGLNGVTLTGAYEALVNGVATQTAAAKNNAEASGAVQDTLQSQRDSLSGVSVDEEAVNLLQQQRAYQGAARVISTVDQLMQTLLSLPI